MYELLNLLTKQTINFKIVLPLNLDKSLSESCGQMITELDFLQTSQDLFSLIFELSIS